MKSKYDILDHIAKLEGYKSQIYIDRMKWCWKKVCDNDGEYTEKLTNYFDSVAESFDNECRCKSDPTIIKYYTDNVQAIYDFKRLF